MNSKFYLIDSTTDYHFKFNSNQIFLTIKYLNIIKDEKKILIIFPIHLYIITTYIGFEKHKL